MSRSRYFTNHFSLAGAAVAVVPNGQVTVYEAGTADPWILPIYAGATGPATKSNPFIADALGNIEFFLDLPARVKIVAVGAGVGTVTADYEPVLPDPSEQVQYTPGDQILAYGSDDAIGLRVVGVGSKLVQTNTAAYVGLQATDASGTTVPLYAQTTPGSSLLLDQQSAYTSLSAIGLAVYKKFRSTPTVIGSANASFNQLAYDGSGGASADPTTVKITQHWTGNGTSAVTSARGLEIEAIRYAATGGTGAAAAVGPAIPSVYGSTRGIDIGLGHDAAITAPASSILGMVGVNVYNQGGFSVDGKSVAGGNKGTTGLAIWGQAGFQYGLIYGGPNMPDLNIGTLTGRIFHIRESGGNDGLLYQTPNTTGTGIRFAASGGGGRTMDVFAAGSAVGAPHTGKLILYDATAAAFLLSAGMNASDPARGQVGVIGGTAAFPGLVGHNDLDTGLVWPGGNVLQLSAGAAAVAQVNGTGLGIGVTPAHPLHVSGANALRIDNAANWTTTIAGTPGGGTALPTNPVGFLKINLGGTVVALPYYLP